MVVLRYEQLEEGYSSFEESRDKNVNNRTKLIKSHKSCKYVYALVSAFRNLRRGLPCPCPQLPPLHHEGWSGVIHLHFPHLDTR